MRTRPGIDPRQTGAPLLRLLDAPTDRRFADVDAACAMTDRGQGCRLEQADVSGTENAHIHVWRASSRWMQ
ncbi:hypothetical protein AvCA_05420 [Azotobacter vinelandii CA]|uniref:Uncharacterized protein n=2 Tax=Azotobacter vinelandii TaxID=354 RepID=C1DKD2_AZOVD|nr:hypothetical protein Avin_05420 [Azotobacter vinelandii DJ]AGK15579.1 hypothetical protein AvCA_05420 [Azotobacter vinelandii CA]AGK19376.1 hypothetical protein AvCA6_05420 [Azotobacter vinelandii CA6]